MQVKDTSSVAEGFQGLRRPAPALEHLARRFAKIYDGHGTVKAAVQRFGNEIMDAMSELVEQCHSHFTVSQETGLLGGRLSEAAEQRRGRIVTSPVLTNEPLYEVRSDPQQEISYAPVAG